MKHKKFRARVAAEVNDLQELSDALCALADAAEAGDWYAIDLGVERARKLLRRRRRQGKPPAQEPLPLGDMPALLRRQAGASRAWFLAAVAALALTGCAVCREHPTACKAVAAVVIDGTVIALDRHRHAAPPPGSINSGRFPPELPRPGGP